MVFTVFTVKTAAAKSLLAVSHERSAKKPEMSRSQRSKVALCSVRDWGLFIYLFVLTIIHMYE